MSEKLSLTETLLAEITKGQDSLSEVEFTLNEEKFKFNYRYLTLLEKVRIEQLCIKVSKNIDSDGAVTTTMDKQDHLIPIYTILEKSLDKDGKKLFSPTNPQHFKLVSDFLQHWLQCWHIT